ncbi:MAG: hypothetical protein DYG98_03820 [Haliscomenobacteraceae bacterium CHB4]|nr:hypothetical protein [Haliscomenobacteraceae bacterium CHB4]
MVTLAFLSCDKEEESLYWGETAALKNGSNWNGKIRAISNNFAEKKIDIAIRNYDSDGIWLETLSFVKIPLKIGEHPLSYTFNQPPDDSLSGALYTNGYDDEVYDFYKIAENDSTSYLEITDYNEQKAEIKGNFSLILWRRKDLPGAWNAPDSIVFSNGVFHTRISN